MKKSNSICIVLGMLCLVACGEQDSSFLITENSVGPLFKETPTKDLEAIFSKDSVVMDTSNLKVGASTRKIKVFEKGGKHLLTLTPNQDSIPTVENIRIFDSRYESKEGLGLKSSFKDIKTYYAIKKIVTTISSVVVFPKESNLYFTLDKADLPSSLRYTNSNIEAVQIPDETKIKYLMMGWD